MKKYVFALVALLAMTTQMQAQKFLEIYRNGRVVSSVKASNVDSMVIGGEESKRTLVFYREGEAFHHTRTAIIDSIKVFKAEDEPLVYLGIVGFNQELYDKEFGLLDKNSASEYKTFLGNLTRKDGTLLYYGVDHAIDMLKKASFPTQVSSVNLITFTDGLDQGSLMMNSNYSTDEQYLNAVNKLIGNTKVKGLPLTAYSLGLRGSDVTDYALFQRNLSKLASSSDKAYEVSSMGAVRTRLQEISDQIISISNKQNISMKIPGQSNGTLIRFTFDNTSVDNSSLYIEGTFNLASRSLTNVTYHGIKATSGSYVQGTQDGIFVTFTFTGMQRQDGNGLIPKDYIREYYKTASSTIWQENSEFTPANNTLTTVSHAGAVILLVLDCSNSLGSQFSNMQTYAKDFIDRVANNAQIHIERPFYNGVGCYVDLGLPSGTLWATCNIGATSPEEYGDYFAWGETEGYDSGKTYFDWKTYKWCNGSEKTMTKYCYNSSYGYNGFTDNKTELDQEDDAAYVNCGPAWRMPSMEQFQELINSNYTTTEWTMQNGVNGRKITSKSNGNSIFLPAAGFRFSSSLDVGSYGHYLSRTLSSGLPAYAGNLNFNSRGNDTNTGYGRSGGLSVRPVRRSE